MFLPEIFQMYQAQKYDKHKVFAHVLILSNLNKQEAAKLLRVSPQTVTRWLQHGSPVWALEILMMAAGQHPLWPGLRFGQGEIDTGETVITARDISNIEIERQLRNDQIAALTTTIRRLEDRLRIKTSANDAIPETKAITNIDDLRWI